jgi:N-carbamoyl-L-amino-acid hydrolase
VSVVAAADLAILMAGVEPIGLGPAGTTRLAWTPEDDLTGEWFAAQADAIGLRVERDPAGNRWALPPGDGPWWAVGSHLDSVRDGGRFDGALGVAAAFAVAARCSRPIAVVSFADEEGARFNTPTFGSRALTGVLVVDDVLARADDAGVTLPDAMRAAGVDPDGLTSAPRWLDRLRGFVELHIDQSRDVDAADAPFGVVSALAARRRLALELRGRADHAGTTSMAERRDALAVAARVIVAALDFGAPADLRITPGRILVEPNALTTIPERVRLWLDARGADGDALDAFVAALEQRAAALATEGRVELELRVESRSDGTTFDPGLRERLLAADGPAPEVLCFAGHDAGLVGARRPAAMVLVRNPTGISHAAAEEVALDDAAAAATAILRLLEEIA